MGYQKSAEDGLTDAQRRVLRVVIEHKQASPQQIQQHPDCTIGKVMLHRHLRFLVEKGLIFKIGSPPKVFYEPTRTEDKSVEMSIVEDFQTGERIESLLDRYFAYAHDGRLEKGLTAFKNWFFAKQIPVLRTQKSKKVPYAQQVQKNFIDLLERFVNFREKFRPAPLGGSLLLDGTDRYKSIHNSPCIEKVFYLDFYSIPQFGKTYSGYLVQKAKVGDQSSLKYIDRIHHQLEEVVFDIIENLQIDACLWVPHSIDRNVSLLDELQRRIYLTIPKVKVDKVFAEDTVPQKSISDLKTRIINAHRSNVISEPLPNLKKMKKLLIIDDAIGSNATIHAIAKKLLSKNPSLKIFGIGIVGSFKGFDVIQDI